MTRIFVPRDSAALALGADALAAAIADEAARRGHEALAEAPRSVPDVTDVLQGKVTIREERGVNTLRHHADEQD